MNIWTDNIRIILIVLVLAVSASAEPLYIDESGWSIVFARDSEELVSKAFDIANMQGVSLSDVAPVFNYMAFHDPANFYGLLLRIPDDLTTYWARNSVVTAVYVAKSDTLKAASIEFMITSKMQRTVIHSFEIEGFVPIPTAAYEQLSTSRGDIVIFVRFPFERRPDEIIRFEIENVRSKRR